MDNKKRKMLVMDLDGTALNDDSEFGSATVEALRNLKAAGHVVCFATGRMASDIRVLGEDVMVADYLIYNNGGIIYDVPDQRYIRQALMPAECVEKIVNFCLPRNLTLYVVCGEDLYVNKFTERVYHYMQYLNNRFHTLSKLSDIPMERVEVLMSTEEENLVSAFIDQEGLPVCWMKSEPGCMDITPQGISKWNGIEEVMQLNGIAREDVIVVGNYNNDIEMITKAGIGVAVQNALPEVKAAAGFVTKRDNNQNAIVEVIEKFIN